MSALAVRLLGGLLALGAAAAVHAQDAAALTRANFVDVGDRLADVLVTSGLAFSTMIVGTARDDAAAPRHAALHLPKPSAGPHWSHSACPGGGSVRTAMYDVDGSAGFSARDRFVTVFESCMVEGSVVTGRSEFAVAAHRFEGHTEVTELEFQFSEIGTAELRWSGPASVVLRTDLRRGTERYVVQYRELQVTRGARRMRWSFTLDLVRPPIGEQVASIEGTIDLGGLALRLRQDEPFAIAASGFPQSGQLSARDAKGARLEIEAARRRYSYRLFLAGNHGGRADAASTSRPYSSAASPPGP